MRDPLTRPAVIGGLFVSLLFSFIPSYAQRSKSALVCKKPVLAALKPKPELTYPCDEKVNDWDEKVLKLPARVAAIKTLIAQLSSVSDAVWWGADVVDLGVCEFTHEPGALTREQRRGFTDGDYLFWLFGNDRIRLMLIPDPCYQTEYGGSNAFLLYRKDGRVFVTEVLDGYFSRADNPVNLAFARLNTEEIIEVSTWTGGLNPDQTNYYFVIDPHTNQAVPKNLFPGEKGRTNQISSAILLSAGGAEPLKVVRGNSLAPSFTIYVDDTKGKIDDNGRALSHKILRWDGKAYR